MPVLRKCGLIALYAVVRVIGADNDFDFCQQIYCFLHRVLFRCMNKPVCYGRVWCRNATAGFRSRFY